MSQLVRDIVGHPARIVGRPRVDLDPVSTRKNHGAEAGTRRREDKGVVELFPRKMDESKGSVIAARFVCRRKWTGEHYQNQGVRHAPSVWEVRATPNKVNTRGTEGKLP